MPFSSRAKTYTEAFLRLFYPAYCGICRSFLEVQEHGLCGACAASLQPLQRQLDTACLSMEFEHVDNAWSLYPYRSPVKELLRAVKFQRRRWLLKPALSRLDDLLSPILSETHYDAIVPVPIDRERLLEREFNQAELLANFIGRTCGVPVRSHFLKKHSSIPAQSLLRPEERLTNPIGAFRATASRKIRGKNLLLVDDIVTTGATADEAARQLKQAGARRIDLLTLACSTVSERN